MNTENETSGIELNTIERILKASIYGNFLVWHLFLFFCTAVLSALILLCCCVRFRIPRTKQEIEADYIRKKIARKFRKQLNIIPDVDMDEMDLPKALQRIRFELMTDEEKEKFTHMTLHRIEEPPDSTAESKDEDVAEETEQVQGEEKHFKAGTSEEKLLAEGNSAFSNKLVTIVNAFNVLKLKRINSETNTKSKQITV